jgi:hypothetical protein
MRVLRASLLSGASFIALAASAAPDRALAACSGQNQTISTHRTGPVVSDGGAITITSSGFVSGGTSQTGVLAKACPATTLSNSGTIAGGAGQDSDGGAVGGAGVSNSATITKLSNTGTISGGFAYATASGTVHASGGAGVSNSGTIKNLTNHGTINGGASYSPTWPSYGGAGVSNSGTITKLTNTSAISGAAGTSDAGGAGVWNSGTIRTLTNSGAISGGMNGDAPGAGVSNESGAKIGSLTNAEGGTISGGAGRFPGGFVADSPGAAGVSNFGKIEMLNNQGNIKGGNGASLTDVFTAVLSPGAAGGAGVANGRTVGALTNSGTIRGGAGGNGGILGGTGAGGAGLSNWSAIATMTNSGTIGGGTGGNGGIHGDTGGAGGAAISNSGALGMLTNSGTIRGGAGGHGPPSGASGDAIYSAGTGASIGPVTNPGRIVGNVVIDNQAKVSVTGGTGATFGSWRGGVITIGAGNLTFASGNTALGDDISVDGGAGTVTNLATLEVAAPEAIAGNFTQTAAGVLDLDFAGDLLRQHGVLSVSKLATLSGTLAIDLTDGFTLATGESLDILDYTSFKGNFASLDLDGAACTASSKDSWTCGGRVQLKERRTPDFLDLIVMHGDPVGSAVPEPSTWAMLALGFLGLGGLGVKGRTKAAAS